MTRDPREGVGPDGCIRTGVADGELGAPYVGLLEVAVQEFAAAAGPTLHSLYVYGSVATGQARPPHSDLDLYAIVTEESTALTRVAAALSERHADVVREVGVSTVTLDTVLADTPEGHAERCFLRHYCRHLTGSDLRAQFPDCRANVALAHGFNGNVGGVIDGIIDGLADDSDLAARGAIAAGSRKLLMAAATLLSARDGGWTTDRDEGAERLVDAAPELTGAVTRVRTWSGLDDEATTLPARDEVIGCFVALRDWLVREYDDGA